jgi:hypothetical protein
VVCGSEQAALPADNDQHRQLKAILSTMHLELVYGTDELSGTLQRRHNWCSLAGLVSLFSA